MAVRRSALIRRRSTVFFAAAFGLFGSVSGPVAAAPLPAGDDITSYSAIRKPVERNRVTDGATALLVTSFCAEQIGSGVEILVQGFPSGSVIEASINNQRTHLVETRPGIYTQIRTTKAPSYRVVVSTPDGARTTIPDLEGCR